MQRVDQVAAKMRQSDKPDQALRSLKTSLMTLNRQRSSSKKPISTHERDSMSELNSDSKENSSAYKIDKIEGRSDLPASEYLLGSHVSRDLFSNGGFSDQRPQNQLARIVSNTNKALSKKSSNTESAGQLQHIKKKPPALVLDESIEKVDVKGSTSSKTKKRMLQLSDDKPLVFLMGKFKDSHSSTPKYQASLNFLKNGGLHKPKLTLSPKQHLKIWNGLNHTEEGKLTPGFKSQNKVVFPRSSKTDEKNSAHFLARVKEQLEEVGFCDKIKKDIADRRVNYETREHLIKLVLKN